jgi:hypothetical protein
MNSSIYRYAAGVAVIALLAGCAGRYGALPVQTTPSSSRADVSALVFPDGCSDPKTLKACLKAGASHRLGITLTCHLGTVTASCGKVTWSTKTSNKLLKGRFKPNPGNPTVETITAAKTIEVGHYSQEITAVCTGVPGCGAKIKALIWIVK